MGQDTAASAAEKMSTWDDRPYYLISFAIHKSRRYHAKMSALYQGLSDIVLSMNAVAGTSAFIVLIGGKSTIFAQALVGLVAVGSALDKVLGFSNKAKQHYDLCRRFTELAANLAEWDATEENYRMACAARLRIEANEPTIKRLVDIHARNEELQARGYPSEDFAPLSTPQRWFGYFFTFGMDRLNRWRSEREKQLTASSSAKSV